LGGGSKPPPYQLEGLGSDVSSLSGVRDGALMANAFESIENPENASSGANVA